MSKKIEIELAQKFHEIEEMEIHNQRKKLPKEIKRVIFEVERNKLKETSIRQIEVSQ